MKKSVFLLTWMLFALTLKGQKVTFDLVDWKTDQTVKIKFDFSGTPFSGFAGNLYLWSWVNNSAGQGMDSPNNGTWAASSVNSLLTDEGNNIRSIGLVPSTYFNQNTDFLSVAGINFLVKNQTGTQQTSNFEKILPFYDNGIKPNTAWVGSKEIRIMVDVTATPLDGFSGPLYFWTWYNTGTGDNNSPNNGNWNASPSNMQMTRIGSSNLWYFDFVPNDIFGTSAVNFSNSNLFGLVKKLNGNDGKTNDFGAGKTHLKYFIFQKNASNITLTPTLPPDNVPVTIQFIARESLKNSSASIFMHAGVVTDGLSSTSWNNTRGIWGDSLTSPGKMTKTGLNTYEITIPSIRDYFQLTPDQTAYKIMAVFRNADGTVVEKDGSADYQLQIQAARYLEIREPLGAFSTSKLNQPFRITGYSNETSDITIKVDGTAIFTSSAINRGTQTFTPTLPGVYDISVEADFGDSVFVKNTKVTVCSTQSIDTPLALPAGLKYGINYNPADNTQATLVLHAPTESIKSVHIIGDMNDWTVDCDFLMNYDNVKKVFWKNLSGLIPHKEYVFQYLIDGETRIGDPYTQKVSDPWNDGSISPSVYPDLIPYPEAARPKNGEVPTIASVLQTAQSNYSWEITSFKRHPQEKLNIYQLHFRDFTSEGTYLAAIEKLDYLKRLGINAIETLPVSEFEGNDSWGYNPNFYFAADKAYGKPDDYKKFVDECHKRGIAVIGDLVLNHAFGTNPHARMYWDNLRNRPATNNPWFNAVSNFSNPAAQWGNDLNHESVHTKAFVDSAIVFWLKEFRIDGIRFDFTKGFGNTPYPNGTCGDEWGGCYDASRIALLKRMADKMWLVDNGATGSQPYVIFEHLATPAEDQEIGNYGNGIMLWSGVSPNHKYGEIAMGWAPDAGDPNKSNVSEAYYKNKGFTKPVWVSYMESHDEDRLGYFQTVFGNGIIKTDLAVRSQFLQAAAAMNLLFTGPRQVWQFGELGYDYNINFNGRTGKKPVRWDYFDMPERKKIYETYARLFWLRNRYPLTFHKDVDNPGGTKTDWTSQFKRYHFYSSVGDTAVTIIANTANSVMTGNPEFNASVSNQWYDLVSNQWLPVSSSMTLQPGEFKVFFNKKPAFNPPTLSFSSIKSPGIVADTSRLFLNFDEPVLKKDITGFLGANFNSGNAKNTFLLKNHKNEIQNYNFSIDLNQNKITIIPTQKLPVGNYSLTINKDSVQNFGGIYFENDQIFNFTIEGNALPCQNNQTFVSPMDNLSGQSLNVPVINSILSPIQISGDSKVIYDAGKSVTLSPGFKVTASVNSYFIAKIGGCN
ncbi:MAG: hypothetical protein IPH28_01345 [Cytophagaceae bacterium]|nr:hypothetical protein [Cytophagaceae bacterium]